MIGGNTSGWVLSLELRSPRDRQMIVSVIQMLVGGTHHFPTEAIRLMP